MSADTPSSTRVCPACTYQGEEETCPECGVKTLSAAAFEKEDPTLGKVFADRYEVLDVLGRGGQTTRFHHDGDVPRLASSKLPQARRQTRFSHS